MRHAIRHDATAFRRGFTLVEVLVVLAIIAVLIGLGTAAIMKTRTVQETRNTSTLITKVDQAFQKRWLATIETARNETPCPLAQSWALGSPARAQVIHIKLRLIQEFPVSFKEATSNVGAAPPVGLGPNPTYLRALANATAGARTPQEESSACLYLALKRQTRGVEFDPDTALSTQELLAPIPTDNIKEIVDPWKVVQDRLIPNDPNPQTPLGMSRPQPLVFVRFPGFNNKANGGLDSTGLLQLPQFRGGAQPFPPSYDPVDPEGTLADPAWVGSPGAASFAAVVHPVAAKKTFTLFPVIASSGQDSTTFFYNKLVNNQVTVVGADDIYNFVLSAK